MAIALKAPEANRRVTRWIRRARIRPPAGETSWHWHIDELSFFRGIGNIAGWAACHPGRLRNVAILSDDGRVAMETRDLAASPDVAGEHGPDASRCRFRLAFTAERSEHVRDARLRLTATHGAVHVIGDLVTSQLADDPYHQLVQRFFTELQSRPPGRVIELGPRNRSGNVRRSLVAPHEYRGLDVVAGDNVDIVADAHELGRHVDAGSFDAAFSMSTFEHLAMPWKVVLEINRALKPGGLVLVTTHQAFPLHETPWDFWRYSDAAWPALFNAATGFEVIDVALGEPASVVPHLLHAVTTTLELQPAFIGSAVLARKIGDTELEWNVPTDLVTGAVAYPA